MPCRSVVEFVSVISVRLTPCCLCPGWLCFNPLLCPASPVWHMHLFLFSMQQNILQTLDLYTVTASFIVYVRKNNYYWDLTVKFHSCFIFIFLSPICFSASSLKASRALHRHWTYVCVCIQPTCPNNFVWTLKAQMSSLIVWNSVIPNQGCYDFD